MQATGFPNFVFPHEEVFSCSLSIDFQAHRNVHTKNYAIQISDIIIIIIA